MKSLFPFLILCLCSGCAFHHVKPLTQSAAVPDTEFATDDVPEVGTPEEVKAYPVGRYSDPDYPDEMHERHTLYRREETSSWNYQPSGSYSLPLSVARLGPTATSNPSPSYYEKTDEEEINAQQRAYATALQEQNRVLKKRIESLQQDAGKVPTLQQELEKLKKQLEALPAPQTPVTPIQPEPSETNQEEPNFTMLTPSMTEEPFTQNTP